MSTKEANIALLSNENPLILKSAEDIYSELAESRACYERGEYEDFDDALDDISKRYDL